jgi:hypothetical protein
MLGEKGWWKNISENLYIKVSKMNNKVNNKVNNKLICEQSIAEQSPLFNISLQLQPICANTPQDHKS